MEKRVLKTGPEVRHFKIIHWLGAMLLFWVSVHSSAENRVLELDFAEPERDMTVAMQDLFQYPPYTVKLVLDTPQDGPVRLSLKPYQPFKKVVVRCWMGGP